MFKTLLFAAVVAAFAWQSIAPAMDAVNNRAAVIEAATR